MPPLSTHHRRRVLFAGGLRRRSGVLLYGPPGMHHACITLTHAYALLQPCRELFAGGLRRRSGVLLYGPQACIMLTHINATAALLQGVVCWRAAAALWRAALWAPGQRQDAARQGCGQPMQQQLPLRKGARAHQHVRWGE
jgi:hypothetical protein